MEEGSLRCDVNISLREIGETKFGTKVEIKNLNSIANVQKAIEFEIARQEAMILNNEEIIQETRRFDEATKSTILMRVKTDSVDYKYFPETNIAPIKLSDEFIKEAIETSPELAESKLIRYKELGLSDYDASILISDKDISVYYDEALKTGASYKLVANWVIGDVQAILNKQNISIKQFRISPIRLGELIKIVESGKISNKQARDVFNKMLDSDDDINKIIDSLGASQISDTSLIESLVKEVIDANPQSVVDYKNGKDRAVGFLVGQVMKKSQGKANPALTNKMIVEELKRR